MNHALVDTALSQLVCCSAVGSWTRGMWWLALSVFRFLVKLDDVNIRVTRTVTMTPSQCTATAVDFVPQTIKVACRISKSLSELAGVASELSQTALASIVNTNNSYFPPIVLQLAFY